MLEFLDRLRARPLHERKRITLASTSVIFIAVFLVWWATFTSPVNEESVSATEVATPLTVVGNLAFVARDSLTSLPGKIITYMKIASSSSATTSDVVYPEDIFVPRPTVNDTPLATPTATSASPSMPEIEHVEIGTDTRGTIETAPKRTGDSPELHQVKPGKATPQATP